MIYLSICVIFDFFHQHVALFRVPVFCLLRLVYSWTFYSFLKNNFYLFASGCAGSSLLHVLFSSSNDWGVRSSVMHGLHVSLSSLVAEYGLLSAQASVVDKGGLVVAAWALQCWLSSCGTQA